MAGRYQGRLESALSALGVRQGFALANAFRDQLERGKPVPARIISSPLLRCAATARFTADHLGVVLETDERLIEIAHGTWEGRYRDDLAREEPELYAAWRNDPARVSFDGGESLADVLARWRAFAHDLATRSSSRTTPSSASHSSICADCRSTISGTSPSRTPRTQKSKTIRVRLRWSRSA
jgi:broad specificity phosphatase PhoE